MVNKRKYRKAVDPAAVEEIEKRIYGLRTSKFDLDIYEQAIKIHRKMRFVDDRETGSTVQRPEKTYEDGGDCEDRSVLLVSLFERIRGVDSRFVLIPGNPYGHLSVEVRFPESIDKAEDRLSELYNSRGGLTDSDDGRREYTFCSEDGGWLIADHSSNYIGDIDGLAMEGYIDAGEYDLSSHDSFKDYSNWGWTRNVQYQRV